MFVHSTLYIHKYIFYRIEPCDNEGIGNSQSSDSSTVSSEYCFFSTPAKPSSISISQESKSSSSSEDYMSLTVSIIFLVLLKAFHYITL